MKLINTFLLVLCFSRSSNAQNPIINSALFGEWKLVTLENGYDSYNYDTQNKKLDMSSDLLFAMGEYRSKIFENKIRQLAEKSSFKLTKNGQYELNFGK
ncbi:hypothetical protein [Halpernia sp. GG3]